MVTINGNTMCPSCNCPCAMNEYDTARPDELETYCFECGYLLKETFRLDREKYEFVQKHAVEFMDDRKFNILAALLDIESYSGNTLKARLFEILADSQLLINHCFMKDKNGVLLTTISEECGGTGIYYLRNTSTGANYSKSLPNNEVERNACISALIKERETNSDISITIHVYDQEQQTAIIV